MSTKKIMDGNEAAAYVSYAFTEISAIYPITPSSPMAEKTDEWAAQGRKNIFGQRVTLTEMQSEAGAVAALHGALETGAYATSYTSSQGLLLMIPVLHRIAGSRLPAVLHVASRTVGTHAMSIFGDHSDVMNCRQTGFAMLSSGSVQEVMDLGAVTHLSAIKSSMPFLHFFDGFRTSHEMQKIDALDYAHLSELVDYAAVDAFRKKALNPEHPTLRNTVQNPDIYFQVREANNPYYNNLPDTVEDCMNELNKLTGRNYALFNYYGAADAERVIVAMGSVSGTILETVETLRKTGEKVGFVQVHLYRPFSIAHFLSAMPTTVKHISVLDRTKESGALGEPLYQDICAVYANERQAPFISRGRYGLSSKDTTPKQIKAVFDNMKSAEFRDHFTIGIRDDITHLSLAEDDSFAIDDSDVFSCKFWGLGSDGTVGANKNSIKIIGEHTKNYVQAYFEYDTKKSFGVTRSHLRIGKSPIQSSYLVKDADFIACHNHTYIHKYDIVSEIKDGGTLLLNSDCDDAESLSLTLPNEVKKILPRKNISLYTIDANRIAKELGLGDHINIILQAAFFKLSGIIPLPDAVKHMKAAIETTYRNKGPEIITQNLAAVDRGLDGLNSVSVPPSWGDIQLTDEISANTAGLPKFIEKMLIPINALKGDALPVSAFSDYTDGTMPLGTSAYEKRGIATRLPLWNQKTCIQCNRCALVCPHSAIRPYLLDQKEQDAAPEGLEAVPAKGTGSDEYYFSLLVSDLDCTGCGSCADVCPSGEKALHMVLAAEKEIAPGIWAYGLTLTEKERLFKPETVKGSQFRQPLYEFSGACAGCGETPYAKLLTQLFGDRMYWANATGCSQAWGASMPSIPYTTNKCGKGPAWSNSLFENNAEFAFGMLLSYKQQRFRLKENIIALREMILNKDMTEKKAHIETLSCIDAWLDSFDDINGSIKASSGLAAALRGVQEIGAADLSEAAALALKSEDHLTKKSIWMFGGDGWAYDIGYGGLDHVIASGEDVNVFIVDTEVYSNTGGQSSKATPLGAVAQFQAAGKKSPKKNLGKQIMSYGNVYVASVAMGADAAQLLKAIVEAESFPGPSVIIAYAPCVVHGIKAGMSKVQDEMKRAVESGYWPLYRYDPRKVPSFQLDSTKRSLSYKAFLDGEVRYSALERSYPENAQRLFDEAESDATKNFDDMKAMSESKRSSEQEPL